MKALLKILYLLLILLVFALLIGIFLPKKSHVESSILINASPDIVFDQVNTLKNWEKWAPWQTTDNTMKITYIGPSSGVGSSYSWTSKHSTSGTLTITDSRPFLSILTELNFGTRGMAYSPWSFEDQNGKTMVIWAFDNREMGYFERYFTLLFKKSMLNTFSQGLSKLKEVSEALRLDHISNVQEIQLVQRQTIILKDSALLQNLGPKMKEMFGKLSAYAEKRSIQTDGFPFTIYYRWSNEGFTSFACGIPITEKISSQNGYLYNEMPEGKAIMVIHWGNYNSSKPYAALENYLKNHNLQLAGAPWEEYITNAIAEPDTAKWETKVYYPVE